MTGGFRVLRRVLGLDEARKVVKERRSEPLVDLVRQGRSKYSVVMLLLQDPSDFERANLRFHQLQGVFGRKLQAAEFGDTHLPPGVAFVKLPGVPADRIRCWQPGG